MVASIVMLVIVAGVAAAGAVGSVVTVARDGYHRVPSRHA